MDELLAFPPWFLDSLVNVWKALWSSRVLSAIIIRDLSYECWLKKIIVSFLPFIALFNSFPTFLLKRTVTGFPKKWRGAAGCVTDTGDYGVVLMEDMKNGEKKWKNRMGASICQCPKDVTELMEQDFYCLHIPGHFSSSYMKDKEWFGCVLVIGSAALSQALCHWGVLSDTGQPMDVLDVLFPVRQPCMDVFQTPAPQNKTSLSNQVRNGWCCTYFKDKVSIEVFLCLFLWSSGQQIKIRAGAQSLCRLQIHGWFWAWLGESFREPNLPGTVSGMLVDCRPLKVFYILNYSVILREEKLHLWVSIPSHWL